MAILYGTQSNGETLPVLVDQFGNLIAKGIDGAQGIPGPIGPPGVGELPPGATDGALLGWENGELVWITEPLPPVYVPGFRPVIYDGNGATQSITTGFSPGLVWIKRRDNDKEHSIYDTVRGPLKELFSNSTATENTLPDGLKSFNSDGFTVGDGGRVNGDNGSYVAWCWEASGTTVINNDGTIESQVSSNGSFSVVKFYSPNSNVISTFGHGLLSAPKFIITKATNQSYGWNVYHESIGNDKYLYLNSPQAEGVSGIWGNTTPSASLVTCQPSNLGAANYIAWCWAETPGASKFGSYQSTGMRTFIHIGFLPSMVIIKSISTGNWFMFDNARGTQYALRANEAAEEDEIAIVEFKDDGFQLLFAFPGVNTENETYIYAAFANPEDALLAQRQLRRQARQEERQQNETRLR